MTENEQSPPEQYYVILTVRAYETASSVEFVDEFGLHLFCPVERFKTLKEAIMDEFMMTKDFMRENDD